MTKYVLFVLALAGGCYYAKRHFDLDKSLPSAAGSNTAILRGASYLAPAKLVKRYLRHTAK